LRLDFRDAVIYQERYISGDKSALVPEPRELPEEKEKKEKKKTLRIFINDVLSAYKGKVLRTEFIKECTEKAKEYGWKSPNFRREISALIHSGDIVEDKNLGTLCALHHCLV